MCATVVDVKMLLGGWFVAWLLASCIREAIDHGTHNPDTHRNWPINGISFWNLEVSRRCTSIFYQFRNLSSKGVHS